MNDPLLSRVFATEHIDDDGFADRVVAALPSRRTRWRVERRELWIGGGALVAATAGALAVQGISTPVGLVVAASVVAAAVWSVLERALSA
jgi:hypothetical protein